MLSAQPASDRPRCCDLGLRFGVLDPGRLNSITDVDGVRVGHETLIEGEGVRTGVTAILPHPGNVFQEKVPAAIEVGNGFGKLIGSTQVRELGVLETPIVLTNTLSVFTAAEALVGYTLDLPANREVLSVNPVAAEINDGFLNNIRAGYIRREHVLAAISRAMPGIVEEGSIGAGTGARCMGWKGGIGSASRKLPEKLGGHVVGVLVLSNFGGILSIAGVPVGQELGRFYLRDDIQPAQHQEDGSCIVVLATDAPLDARQLGRVARRCFLGLAAAGSPMTHGSGDYAIAFTTSQQMREVTGQTSRQHTTLSDEQLSPLFQAAKEATEEAVVNSLLRARTITGFQGRTVEAIPVDRVIEICKRHGAIR